MEASKPQTTSSQNTTTNSSIQFLHFLRLMHLFPDVHPATLHTVLWICKSDFFCAVDKLLYAKRCKEMQIQRNTARFSKSDRYQPYCQNFNRVSGCPGNGNQISIAASSSQRPSNGTITVHPINSVIKIAEQGIKQKLCETKNLFTRNRSKTREKTSVSSTSNNDLQIVVSPECKLPIHPLSPISTEIQDSEPATAKENQQTL